MSLPAMPLSMTPAELKAIYDLLCMLSGGDAREVFSWDGNDDINDPLTMAMLKVFMVAGQQVPDNLQGKIPDVVLSMQAPLEALERDALLQGVLQEREACACLVEQIGREHDQWERSGIFARAIAKTIRQRGQKAGA